jgi:hypothetical protein
LAPAVGACGWRDEEDVMAARTTPPGATGGGRWVSVAPERLERWFAGFAERHGGATWSWESGAGAVLVGLGGDGAVASCEVPFGPLTPSGAAPESDLAAHAGLDRRVGALLVRSGGFAAGVFRGEVLQDSRVGRRRVQGRSAAGGSSQHRFARRRELQTHQSRSAAADLAARVLLPAAGSLDALVLGGDRASVAEVLADPRLARLAPLVTRRLLAVPDPRHAVLLSLPGLFRAVRIRVVDPPGVP